MFKRMHPLTDEGTRRLRDSAILPTIKCSTCGQEVHLRLMPTHNCSGRPKPPRLNSNYKARGYDDYDESLSPVDKFPAMPPTYDAEDKPKVGSSGVGGKKLHNILEPSAEILDEDIVDEDFDQSSIEGTLSPGQNSPTMPTPDMYSTHKSRTRTETNNASSTSTTVTTTSSGDGFANGGDQSYKYHNSKNYKSGRGDATPERVRPNLTISTQKAAMLSSESFGSSTAVAPITHTPRYGREGAIASPLPMHSHAPQSANPLHNNNNMGAGGSGYSTHHNNASSSSLASRSSAATRNQRSPSWSIYGLGHVPIQGNSPSQLEHSTNNVPARSEHYSKTGRYQHQNQAKVYPTKTVPYQPSVSQQAPRMPLGLSHQNLLSTTSAHKSEKILRSNSDRHITHSPPKPPVPTRSTSATAHTRLRGTPPPGPSGTSKITSSSHTELTKLVMSASKPMRPELNSTRSTASTHSSTSSGTGSIPAPLTRSGSDGKKNSSNKKAEQLDSLMGDLMIEIEALTSRAKVEQHRESVDTNRRRNNSNNHPPSSQVIMKSPIQAEVSHGECQTCYDKIFERPIIVEGKTHHRMCLRCHQCGCLLDPHLPADWTIAQDGNMYCSKHVPVPPQQQQQQNMQSTGSRTPSPAEEIHHCAGCRKRVNSDAIEAFGLHWHPKHLVCYTCGTGLCATEDRYEHDGRVYCKSDYQKLSAVNCIACNRPHAPTDSLTALNARWHISCFNCQVCHKGFPDKSFYVLENKPYCKYHYHELNDSLCKKCEEPIEGACAQVIEGRFHPECFVCETCNSPLRDIYYNINNKFYCEKHIVPQGMSTPADDGAVADKFADNKRRTIFCDL